MNYGPNIRAARKAAGLTQEQLAEKCGMATITIRQYELGKREPRMAQLDTIAAALNTNVLSLMVSDKSELPIFFKKLDFSILSLIKDGYESDAAFYEAFLGNKVAMAVIDSMSERQLVKIFEKLNDSGRKKAVELIEELASKDEYQLKEPTE